MPLDNHDLVYYFGWGANSEAEMVASVIGRVPDAICKAVLRDYQLCVQTLKDVPDNGDSPRAILRKVWGEDFKSYVIQQSKGHKLEGSLYRMTAKEIKMLDIWELVIEGWQEPVMVEVVDEQGKVFKAHTQAIPKDQSYSYAAEGFGYNPWIMPKQDLIRVARNDAKRYPNLLR